MDWLVLGGAIATEDNWRHVAVEWQAALDDVGISVFRMADFEAYQGEFKDLTKAIHEVLLRRLLDIQKSYITEIFGVTNWKGNYRGSFRTIYTKSLENILTVVAQNIAPRREEKISLVFAKHQDVSLSTVRGYFDAIRVSCERLGSCVIAHPAENPCLQLADMIAYELSHSMRDGMPSRYPFKRMKEHANVNHFLLLEARSSSVSFGRASLSLSA